MNKSIMIKNIVTILLLICFVFQADAAKKYLGKNPGPVARRKSKYPTYTEKQATKNDIWNKYPYKWNLLDAIARGSRTSYSIEQIRKGDKFLFRLGDDGIYKCFSYVKGSNYTKFVVAQTFSNNTFRVYLQLPPGHPKPPAYRENMEAVIMTKSNHEFADGEEFNIEGIYQYQGIINGQSILGYKRSIALYKEL